MPGRLDVNSNRAWVSFVIGSGRLVSTVSMSPLPGAKLRVRLEKKTDGDNSFDRVFLYSMEHESSQNRPRLSVQYEVP